MLHLVSPGLQVKAFLADARPVDRRPVSAPANPYSNGVSRGGDGSSAERSQAGWVRGGGREASRPGTASAALGGGSMGGQVDQVRESWK